MASLVEIFPSDIISESMHKINYNFNLLENRDDVSEQKIQWLKDQIDQRLDEITRTMNENDLNLGKGIDNLSGLFDSMSSSVDIQNAINEALENANIDLTHFIEQTIGQKVREAMAGYSVDSMLTRDQLTGILTEYARSDAFLNFKSEAERQFAEARLLAANSTFFMMNGHLVYKDSRGESSYTSLEDWYSKDSSVRAIVNPDNDPNWKDDPNKVDLLKQEGEKTFKTLATEMATLDLTVQPGQAAANIIATVKSALGAGDTHSDDAEDITAAIFVKADSMSGSEIILSADKINFRGHAFKLSADGIRIESTNFNVNENGHVEAKDIVLKENVTANNMVANNMKAYNMESHDMTAIDMTVENMTATNVTANGITATDITLKSKNGVTKIDENGVLWAYGAHIDGDVDAKRFLASKDVNIDTTEYSGTITKNTTITGDSFGMVANGTLTSKNGGSDINVSGNSLYIELVDELPNTDNPDIPDRVMYGVPTLCMKYIDQSGKPHIYKLKPGSWLGEGSSDTSDFRWYNKYGANVLNYNFNANAINTYPNKVFHNTLSANFPGELYLFKPENTSYFLTNNGVDQIYRLQVNSFDQEDASTQLDYLKDSGLVNSSDVTTSNVNEHTVYALRSKINRYGGSTYCDQSSSLTNITDDICNNEFSKYLQSTISAGVTYSYSNIFTSLTTDYGVNNLYNFILYATGGSKSGVGIEGSNDYGWKMDLSVLNLSSVDAVIQGSEKLVNNLPFTTGGYYTTNTSNNNTIQDQEFVLNISAHPMINITDSGKTVASTTNLVYVNCSVTVFGRYAVSTNPSNDTSVYPIQFYTMNLYNGIGGQNFGGVILPQYITINLNFDCVFKLSSGMSFDPLSSTTKDTILNKVYAFMSSYPFKSDHADYTYNNHTLTGYAKDHVQYSATLVGNVKVSNGDGTGSFTEGSATFTKTSIS